MCRQHPSKIECALLNSVSDQSVAKRLITCVLAALRANGNILMQKTFINHFIFYIILLFISFLGSFGIHTAIRISDKDTREFYVRLGFVDLVPPLEENSTIVTMCRTF